MNRIKPGDKFGKLTVVKYSHTGKRGKTWECLCECGGVRNVSTSTLNGGHVKSCGCLIKEAHGHSGTTLYTKWASMKSRCYNPKNKAYLYYGAKGISVCDEWNNSFMGFRTWALRNGYLEGLGLIRKDKNGDFTPDNCFWGVSYRRKKGTILEYNGQKKNITAWAKDIGVSRATLWARINQCGMSVDEAIGMGSGETGYKKYYHHGRRASIREISEKTGIRFHVLRYRIERKHMTVKQAVKG